MADQLSDDELSAALAGDPSGFSAVYTVISPAVLGYFRARGVDDAEALTQDVFVDVLPKLANVTGGHTACGPSSSPSPTPGWSTTSGGPNARRTWPNTTP